MKKMGRRGVVFCHVNNTPLLPLSLDRFPPSFPRTRVQVAEPALRTAGPESSQWRIQELSLGGTHGERVEREPIAGVWGGPRAGSARWRLVTRGFIFQKSFH